MPDHSYVSNLIWQIADLLRGAYRPPQLPMTVRHRFDCVLAATKRKVLAEYTFRAVYRRVLEGYAAFVEEFPGANTHGATLEEAWQNHREDVALVLEANPGPD